MMPPSTKKKASTTTLRPTARKPGGGMGYRYLWNLQWYFSYRHPNDRVAVDSMCLPKCKLCGVQVSMAETLAHKVFLLC